MISALSLQNLATWIAQVLMITSIGALLPIVFRIHHPRSTLMYYRILLLAALLLPLLQPIEHEVVVVSGGAFSAKAPALASTPAAVAEESTAGNWRDVVLAVLLVGMIIRVAWLAGGLWQLRRLRKFSTVLHPLPAAVQDARALTKTNALFRISATIKGPVTFGFIHPVILLPKSFLEMPHEAQSSVACHELLHVRRKDWLLTMFEELLAAVLWFQPAVWWLVAQSQLAREQLVDAAVVSLSRSRESYIDTLFSLANARFEADLGVASLFLRRRHLIHRVQSLLTEVSMSRTRLLSSYCSIAVILGVGVVLMFGLLPMTGEAEIRQAPAPVPVPAPAVQTPPGYVVSRAPISYPIDAQQKRIEGQVVVELTFNAAGEIVDSRILSGPEPLRQAALQTALQGKYGIDVARNLQVLVDFKAPAPGQRSATPVPGARGGRGAGVVGGIVAPPAPPAPGSAVRVGGAVAAKNLVKQVAPVYPELAQRAGIQGPVVLEANISKEGKVTNLKVIEGHPLLIQAAIDAVKEWAYQPVLLNGQPVDVVTSVSVNFP